MSGHAPLAGVSVAAVGRRIAVGACASLLARMGARVTFVNQKDAPAHLASFTHGCDSVSWTPADSAAATGHVRAAQVVLLSSDDGAAPLPHELLRAADGAPIRCDITALGHPASGEASWTDADLQAATGITDLTGRPDGPATQVGLPVVELSGALYAAVSVAVGVWRYRSSGARQQLACCLYDTAFNALATFLPAHLGGSRPSRIGNQHPLSAPWDAYLSDAWLLVCSVSDDQWRRLALLIGGEALASEPRFATLQGRLKAREELNALVAQWVRAAPVAERERELIAKGIPCGRVVRVSDLAHEPNLKLREAVATLADGTVVPGGLSGAADWWNGAPATPASSHPTAAVQQRSETALPFEGFRVLEIGQYTTAPLVSRHLGSLGAAVLKIEPPAGDTARAYLPAQDGTSLFFAMTNAGKRCVRLDLATPEGKAAFEELVKHADVLVENLKPEALARLGFGPQELLRLNPRLVYAAISGFGARSLHGGRPAYDTVIQAMSGVMDATSSGDVPMKAGVSIADIAGGQMGLLAVVGALLERERTGRGRFLDVSMQDACAWLAQPKWNGGWSPCTPVQPVRSLAQVCEDPVTQSRKLLVPVTDTAGRTWHLLGSPLSLAGGRPRIGSVELAELGPEAACAWWRGDVPAAQDAHGSLEHSLEH